MSWINDGLVTNKHLNKFYHHSLPSSLSYYTPLAINNQKCSGCELAREEEHVGNLICLKTTSQTDKNESGSCQTRQSQIQHIKIHLYRGTSVAMTHWLRSHVAFNIVCVFFAFVILTMI